MVLMPDSKEVTKAAGNMEDARVWFTSIPAQAYPYSRGLAAQVAGALFRDLAR